MNPANTNEKYDNGNVSPIHLRVHCVPISGALEANATRKVRLRRKVRSEHDRLRQALGKAAGNTNRRMTSQICN